MSLVGRRPLTAPRRTPEKKTVWSVSYTTPKGNDLTVYCEQEPEFANGFCKFLVKGEAHYVSGNVHVYRTTIEA